MIGVDWLEILSLWLLYDSEPPPVDTGITMGFETLSDCWLADELICDDELEPPPIITGIASFA